MKKSILFFVAVLAIAGAGNAHAGSQDKKSGKEVPSFPSANAVDETKPSVTPATTDPAYVIGPQDVLDINVWKEPDMTRVVPVRPDGKISLPLINDVQAAGVTPQQLATDITTKLHKRLRDRRSASCRRVSTGSGYDCVTSPCECRRFYDICQRKKNPCHACGQWQAR
jgi:polysaccharide export outer membrane protein